MKELKMHNLKECEECQKLMKSHGKGCPIFTREAILDFNYISNLIDIDLTERERNEK